MSLSGLVVSPSASGSASFQASMASNASAASAASAASSASSSASNSLTSLLLPSSAASSAMDLSSGSSYAASSPSIVPLTLDDKINYIIRSQDEMMQKISKMADSNDFHKDYMHASGAVFKGRMHASGAKNNRQAEPVAPTESPPQPNNGTLTTDAGSENPSTIDSSSAPPVGGGYRNTRNRRRKNKKMTKRSKRRA